MKKNIVEYLDNTALIFPDKTAFVHDEISVTFAQLQNISKRIGSAIIKSGRFGKPIAIAMKNKVHSVIGFMASAYSGNFYVPIDTEMPQDRLKKIIESLSCDMVLIDDEIDGDYYNSLLNIGLKRENIFLFDEISQSDIDCDLLKNVEENQIDTDIVYTIFTSGSSGTAKGVCVNHRALIDHVEWFSEQFDLDSNVVFGGQFPLFFDASISELYSTIKCGGTDIFISKKMFMSPLKLMDFINKQQVNTIFWVPSILCAIANLKLLDKVQLNLSKVLFAGEAMPVKQLNIWRKALPNALFANCFGPTEITNLCACYIVDREFSDDESLPIGKACRNSSILLLNENNELTKENEIGEICVRGTCVASGYYNDPELTQKVFVQNPLNKKFNDIIYRTGDLGYRNDRGEICFAGRKDYQIKHMGYRIELGEIEHAAMGMPEITAAVALYDKENDRISLAVTPESVDKQDLIDFLKKKIPHYMMPSVIKMMSKFPTNQNGKIDRKKIKEQIHE